MGWPDPYADHNHDFTAEMHFTFPYRGGESFIFRGDDDVFVFINGHLAIDLGGIHTAQTGSVDLDARAAELGLSTEHRHSLREAIFPITPPCGCRFISHRHPRSVRGAHLAEPRRLPGHGAQVGGRSAGRHG